MNTSEIRVIIRYEYKLGNSAAAATRNICKAFGEATVNERTVQRWYQKFLSGDESLQNEPRGRPSIVCDNDVLRALVEENPEQTTRELANQMNHTTILRHLHQIGKVKKLDKWVPHKLSERNKLDRLNACSEHLTRNNRDPFLDRIITCDEKWILYDNRKRSAKWLDKNEAPKHVPKPSLHPRKILITIWWGTHGVVDYSFLPTGETITADKYCDYIDEMHEKLKIQRPALINRQGPILLHDNARPHASQVTVRKLHNIKYEILRHPPYSPDLSPTDFHLFKHMDHFLKGKNFNNEESIKTAVKNFINSKNVDFLKNGIYALVDRWQKCIDVDGDYFD